ncbi:FtsQ-type POTRA domain-containing protein [Streptococcus sp. DTU_2020_1001019_1_SI_AUS_MUR_006]|uniref:cell division protein FtsQ/DivIB n=1 Tax=Streptococcus sp. DTU_2020_1001019_1_SI_AUS_MUR_006 TaxID=3077584 RepID=UPI0028E64ABF|nr:FtsQ-type POTRA domain-containing protein [Streptococcus sp. DTU_2020_1001019_1_SI_AUS_MUR_006]WNS72416.1 FtsQ-type POTRA domain-containing protein [Streptococcus sp. DTU_2020_1001019_1_SI_AUS_MUR_006]
MSKDKKQEPTQGKELSEWQKRNQEYLQKKAEEEAQLAKEKAQAEANKKEVAKTPEEETTLSEWQKQNREYLRKKAEEETKEEQESDLSEDTEEEDDSDSNPEEQKESVEDQSSPENEEETTETEQVEEEDEKSEETKVEEKKVKTKKKPTKPSIPRVHIWRAVTILIPSLLFLVFSIYLLTPFSTLKNIEVTGTVETNADQIKEASGIRDSDYTFSLLLNKDKHAEMIKSNHWIESASIHYQFPTNFTIQVKEYGIVAYYVSGEDHYPILSSGTVETSPVSLVSLPETYLSVLFNDEQQVKTLIEQLAEISPEIKQAIKTIELAPTSVTSDMLKITMYDTDEVLVPLSELGKKLPYYSKIKPQLTVPSGIDMEVGIYSYSLADKALEDERIKAKEEEKKKQEEEKKKQEEQGNQNQTTQQSQSR